MFRVHYPITGKPIHIGEGSTARHLAMEWCPNMQPLSCRHHEKIDPKCVGRVVGMRWTDGNHLIDDPKTSCSSGYQQCGVQLYHHEKYGEVYLVYNPLYHQEALPVPLSTTNPVPISTTTDERLPHPFQ